MQDIKITGDIFFGNDLPYEQKFLSQAIENFGKEVKDCEVSFYLYKRSMTICCQTLIMTKTIAKKLLEIVDLLIDQHFFKANGLRKLGWCVHYMLDRRSLNYYTSVEKLFRKTEVTEFYWFNNLLNRFDKQQTVSQAQICNCMHFQFFIRRENQKLLLLNQSQ